MVCLGGCGLYAVTAGIGESGITNSSVIQIINEIIDKISILIIF